MADVRRGRTSPEERFHYFSDELKTADVVTDSAGNIKSESDYYPFGGELQLVSNDPNKYKYTGAERDSETGLDRMGLRYYSNPLSRFMTPDPLMASGHASNPQTWNRYAYALNNPLRYIDPTGMEVSDRCKKDSKCVITLKLNVVYDKNANDGKGLTDKQKQQFEKDQLGAAEKRYRGASIKLDVKYTAGSWSRTDDSHIKVEGFQKDRLNIMVSDHTPTGAAGDSGVANGFAGIFININEAHSFDVPGLGTVTLPHEMAHHMLGHVNEPEGRFFDTFNKENLADDFAYGAGDPMSRDRYRFYVSQKSYAVQAEPEANKPSTDQPKQ